MLSPIYLQKIYLQKISNNICIKQKADSEESAFTISFNSSNEVIVEIRDEL